MKKFSFDYDATLSRIDVQIFAKNLVEKGHEVWIVTSRPDIYTGEMQGSQPDNRDLYLVATTVGIKPEHIHFTCYELKTEFIEGKGFAFHLDDDDIELRYIRDSEDACIPISVVNVNWRQECCKIIE